MQDSSKDDSAVVILEKAGDKDQLLSREIQEQRRDKDLSSASIRKSPRAQATTPGLPGPTADIEQPLSTGTFPEANPKGFDPSEPNQQKMNADSHMDKEVYSPGQQEAAKAQSDEASYYDDEDESATSDQDDAAKKDEEDEVNLDEIRLIQEQLQKEKA